MWVCIGFVAYGIWNVLLVVWYVLKGVYIGSKHPSYEKLRDNRQNAVVAVLVSWTVALFFYYHWYFK